MYKILEQLQNDLKTANTTISSVFIGGGTPSSVEAKLYEPFFKFLSSHVSKNAEITVEANPNSANFEWLKKMRDFGVNRVSFGVQSFDEKKLKFLGRSHSKDEAINSVLNAQKSGFENISIDIIYDTKFDTKKLLFEDIKIASDLPINHLSAYSLIIEEKTPFFKTPKAKKESLHLTRFLFKTLGEFGFLPYEISNFQRGYTCEHNIGYWEHKKYIGIGSGAVSHDGKSRIYTEPNPKRYIENPNFKTYEKLSKEDMFLEKIFLGLRSFVGIKRDDLPSHARQKADILVKEKKLFLKNERFYNPNFLLSDEIALFLTT